jgi:hypothetical protein
MHPPSGPPAGENYRLEFTALVDGERRRFEATGRLIPNGTGAGVIVIRQLPA